MLVYRTPWLEGPATSVGHLSDAGRVKLRRLRRSTSLEWKEVSLASCVVDLCLITGQDRPIHEWA